MSTEMKNPEPEPQTPMPKEQEDPDSESESEPEPEEEMKLPEPESSSESEYSTDSEYDEEYDVAAEAAAARAEAEERKKTDRVLRPDTPEKNRRLVEELVESGKVKTVVEEEAEMNKSLTYEERYNFPKDPENWREEDLQEVWADRPFGMRDTGYDPVWAHDQDRMLAKEMEKAGLDSPVRPFYVPYRKPYPVIPDNHHDIATPKAAVEELDRAEEFLRWVSYIFPDGSSYEGTIWDDVAQGKGVYVDQLGLIRYEGEWLRNEMEGHGVVEVDIPDDEPIPDSPEEEKMRAEGKIISADYMSPEDREWLKMDVEDSFVMAEGEDIIPWYEREEWVTYFGRKPEKGRYRYAGQFKHGRMHGCGQYDVNERTIFGRFYFGNLLEKPYGCEDEIAAMHAGIAEVAAAKARMFVNKPDGMVREMKGPYSDPQHPYFYEEEDVWMAPGFINQFYEVPDFWKTYVQEVDKERQMWLNSFYKAPLRLPMPAELQYWWEKDVTPEFLLLDTDPKPDPDDPSKEVIEPIVLHTPSGRYIDYTMDDEHGVRLYWVPEDGVVDPDNVQYLPLTQEDIEQEKENFLSRFQSSLEKKCTSLFEKIAKWVDDRRQLAELKLELAQKRLEMIEAEIALETALAEADDNVRMKVKGKGKMVKTGMEESEDELEEEEDDDEDEEEEKEEEKEKEDSPSPLTPLSSDNQDDKPVVKKDNDDEEDGGDVEDNDDGDDDDDDEEEDGDAPSSFGSVNGGKPGPSPFSASSLSFTTSTLASGIPSLLQQSFLSWKKSRSTAKLALPSLPKSPIDFVPKVDSVTFLTLLGPERKKLIITKKSQSLELRAKNRHSHEKVYRIQSLASLKNQKQKRNRKPEVPRNQGWLASGPESELDYILSLQFAHTSWSFGEARCE